MNKMSFVKYNVPASVGWQIRPVLPAHGAGGFFEAKRGFCLDFIRRMRYNMDIRCGAAKNTG